MNTNNMQAFEAKVQMQMQFALFRNCFNDCVNSFREGSLTKSEQACLQNCTLREFKSAMTMKEAQEKLMANSGMGSGPQF